jgi:predicted alpha/beta superfamily hydrolase
MNARFYILFCLAFFAFAGNAQMVLNVVSTPQLTPIRDTLYVAGSFNNWNARDPEFMMLPTPNGYSVSISGESGATYQYKITRGSWPTVEGSSTGAYISNRSLVYQNGGEENITINGWEDIGGVPTITAHLRILDSNFPIPQLNRVRRVWICFPPDYFTTENYYPVVYMHDGQNVFNAATSFAGEWGVDEAMLEEVNNVCTNAIIVAVDNGGGDRLDEYAPWLNTQYNEGGQGGLYASFLVNDLKPYIDNQYRTLTTPEHTAIMGSSLGGLISAYAAFTYPNVFGRVGIFSPAYWFNPQIFDLGASHTPGEGTKIYHVCATNEGNGSVLQDQEEMVDVLLANGYTSDQLFSLDVQNGAHSEWFWKQEYPAAYTWLIDCNSVGVYDAVISEVVLFPNPSDSSIEIQSTGNQKISGYSIVAMNGQAVKAETFATAQETVRASITDLHSGSYFVFLRLESGKRATLRLIKK